MHENHKIFWASNVALLVRHFIYKLAGFQNKIILADGNKPDIKSYNYIYSRKELH
jgi:hypothetical protein